MTFDLPIVSEKKLAVIFDQVLIFCEGLIVKGRVAKNISRLRELVTIFLKTKGIVPE